MRQCVQANIESVFTPRVTQKVRDCIIHSLDNLHLVKIEVGKELAQTWDPRLRRFLLEQVAETSMIGNQLEVNTIQQRSPRCQCVLRRQYLGVPRIVIPLGTLELARQKTDRARILFDLLLLQQDGAHSMLTGINMYCSAQLRVEVPQQGSCSQKLLEVCKSMFTCQILGEPSSPVLASLQEIRERS